jgi:hypothetical protein
MAEARRHFEALESGSPTLTMTRPTCVSAAGSPVAETASGAPHDVQKRPPAASRVPHVVQRFMPRRPEPGRSPRVAHGWPSTWRSNRGRPSSMSVG